MAKNNKRSFDPIPGDPTPDFLNVKTVEAETMLEFKRKVSIMANSLPETPGTWEFQAFATGGKFYGVWVAYNK